MKTLIVLPLALGLLVGCSSNTPYVDKEFGQATRNAFEVQVADPSYRHAGKIPEGIAGLPAEKIMKVYTEGFGEKTKAEVEPTTFETGSSTSSSSGN